MCSVFPRFDRFALAVSISDKQSNAEDAASARARWADIDVRATYKALLQAQ